MQLSLDFFLSKKHVLVDKTLTRCEEDVNVLEMNKIFFSSTDCSEWWTIFRMIDRHLSMTQATTHVQLWINLVWKKSVIGGWLTSYYYYCAQWEESISRLAHPHGIV